MADNFVTNAGSGGATFASDDIGGVQHPRVKIQHGADGSATDVSAAAPLPVTQADQPLPTGAATSAKQDTGNTSLAAIDGKITACNTGAVTVSSSALPAGAATAAKQPALGTAGTPSADVLSIQGTAGMTAVKVDGSAVTQPVFASSLPLPVGAASSARQDTGNASLSSIDGKITACNTGAVTVSAALPAGANAIGDVGLYPRTSGGLAAGKTISEAGTNATSVKGSAGQVYAIFATNVNAAARYLKLYNKASAPTVGTDTPVATLLIPGHTAGSGLHLKIDHGLEFTAGIAFALTTGAADADTGAVAAGDLVVNVFYK